MFPGREQVSAYVTDQAYLTAIRTLSWRFLVASSLNSWKEETLQVEPLARR
jgi:hypothetical protein